MSTLKLPDINAPAASPDIKVMADMDGCFFDFVVSTRTILARHAPSPYIKWHTLNTPPRVWSFWKDWGWSSAAAIETLNANVDELFSGTPPTNARNTLKWLHENTNLTVVTTPWQHDTETCIEAKKRYMELMLGFVPDMIFTDDKAGDWDVVIEDHPEHLAANKHVETLILVQHPYNLDGSAEWNEANQNGLSYHSSNVNIVPFDNLDRIVEIVQANPKWVNAGQLATART